MISKLLICPYFGNVPPWMDAFMANFDGLRELGYNLMIDADENDFRERVDEKLGVVAPPMWGTGKVWDYRPALGLLYEKEIEGYDFYGHIDFDVVLGRVDQWVTDSFLNAIDMHSNCATYVNGCWSLYRNTAQMRELFMEEPLWGEFLTEDRANGWCEHEFSRLIYHAAQERRLGKAWTQWQVFEPDDLSQLRFDEDQLICKGEEVMMAHFRRTKVYPPGCIR